MATNASTDTCRPCTMRVAVDTSSSTLSYPAWGDPASASSGFIPAESNPKASLNRSRLARTLGNPIDTYMIVNSSSTMIADVEKRIWVSKSSARTPEAKAQLSFRRRRRHVHTKSRHPLGRAGAILILCCVHRALSRASLPVLSCHLAILNGYENWKYDFHQFYYLGKNIGNGTALTAKLMKRYWHYHRITTEYPQKK